MQVNIIVSVVVEISSKVLLLQMQSNSYKLPTSNMKSEESPIDTARRMLKEINIDKEAEIKYLIGIYSLSDMEEDTNTLVFAFVARMDAKFPPLADQPTAGKMEIKNSKLFVREEIEKLVEEEKQLEDASISAVILRDYLQGEKYSKDLIKRVEEVKL